MADGQKKLQMLMDHMVQEGEKKRQKSIKKYISVWSIGHV